jgi:hypothetical protein
MYAKTGWRTPEPVNPPAPAMMPVEMALPLIALAAKRARKPRAKKIATVEGAKASGPLHPVAGPGGER